MAILLLPYLWWVAVNTANPRVKAMSKCPLVRTCWVTIYCPLFPVFAALLLIGENSFVPLAQLPSLIYVAALILAIVLFVLTLVVYSQWKRAIA